MRNFDYPNAQEGRMMKNRLATIERVARYLREELEPTDNLPQWTLAKVATAQDRLTSTMQYLVSRMENAGDYGDMELHKAYETMAKMPILNQYLPVKYDVCQNATHYCIDKGTEHKLQKQRKFAYMVATPILVYAGTKLGGKVGIAVSLLGIACGLTHYAQHEAVKNAPHQ